MLKLVLGDEFYDEINNKFVIENPKEFNLNHTLVTISKYESIIKKAFLHKREKSEEEIKTYIKCMSDERMTDSELLLLFDKYADKISKFIEDSHTATVLYEGDSKSNNTETVTSELIYHWMFAMNIPMECENWHINRLLTLIKVISLKNNPPKKTPHSQLAARNRALNEARMKSGNTSG